MAAHHGRDQIQDIAIGASRDGTVTGLDCPHSGEHGRLPRLGHAGRTDSRCVHVQRDLQVHGLPFRLHGRLHHDAVDRRLPRCRTAGGHVRDRADHGRARRRARHGPDGAAPEELDHPRRVPVHNGRWHDLRLGQLRVGDRPGDGHVRLRRAAGRAAGAPRAGRPGPARHRHLDLHRDVRARSFTGAGRAEVRSRRLGDRERTHAANRQGRSRHRRFAARTGSRDRVEPDRRGSARRAVRGRPGDPRRHGVGTAGSGYVRISDRFRSVASPWSRRPRR